MDFNSTRPIETRLDGKLLEREHGGPLRLVVPRKYAY